MTLRTFYRLASTARRIVATSPAPVYDTGCTFCSVPELPSDKQIDFQANLNGTKILPWKHVLILTHGFSDFSTMPSKIELVPGSLSSEINLLKKHIISPHHPILVLNILLKSHKKVLQEYGIDAEKDPRKQLVYLYPDNKVIKFDLNHTQDFVRKYLVPQASELAPVYNPFKVAAEESSSKKTEEPVAGHNFDEFTVDKNLVLICGHAKRDIRCGQLAPLLENEFEQVLHRENLSKITDLGLISHIGGHAYAGNVIYFPKENDKDIIWYGRVFPETVQGIVSETIKKGTIIADLYRGVLPQN